MNEKFPNNDNFIEIQQKTGRVESAVETYENLLDKVRLLKAEGVDPFEYDDYTESPNDTFVDLCDEIRSWESLEDLPMRYITTTEKATAMVQAACIWINAGYTDKKFIKDALDRLRGEERDANENPESGPEVREILSGAVEKLESMLSENKPENKTPALIERAVNEALEKVKDGDLIDAVRLLTATVLHVDFKKFFDKNPEKKKEITDLRDVIREKWMQTRNQGKS